MVSGWYVTGGRARCNPSCGCRVSAWRQQLGWPALGVERPVIGASLEEDDRSIGIAHQNPGECGTGRAAADHDDVGRGGSLPGMVHCAVPDFRRIGVRCSLGRMQSTSGPPLSLADLDRLFEEVRNWGGGAGRRPRRAELHHPGADPRRVGPGAIGPYRLARRRPRQGHRAGQPAPGTALHDQPGRYVERRAPLRGRLLRHGVPRGRA